MRPGLRAAGLVSLSLSLLGCASKDHSAERAARPIAAPLPMAARHLPEGCQAVLHFDLTGSRKEAVAIAETLAAGGTPEPMLLAEVRALGGFDFERDVADALVCFSVEGTELHTLVVAGGDLPRGAVVPALEGSIDGVHVGVMAGNPVAEVLIDARRWWATQAADGAIVFGDDPRLVEAALPRSERARSLGLRFDAPLSLCAEGPALERALRAPSVPAEIAAPLTGATRVMLSKRDALTMRVAYPDPKHAAEASAPLRELLDRRLDESARVVARVDGPEVVLDVDSTHFLRSGDQ